MINLQKRIKALDDRTTEQKLTALQDSVINLITTQHNTKETDEVDLAKIVAVCLSLSNNDCLKNALSEMQNDVLKRS